MSKMKLSEEERLANKWEQMEGWEQFPCKAEIDDFFYPEIIERRVNIFSDVLEQELAHVKQSVLDAFVGHVGQWLSLGYIARKCNMDVCQVRGALYEIMEVGLPVEKIRLTKNGHKVLCYRGIP